MDLLLRSRYGRHSEQIDPEELLPALRDLYEPKEEEKTASPDRLKIGASPRLEIGANLGGSKDSDDLGINPVIFLSCIGRRSPAERHKKKEQNKGLRHDHPDRPGKSPIERYLWMGTT